MNTIKKKVDNSGQSGHSGQVERKNPGSVWENGQSRHKMLGMQVDNSGLSRHSGQMERKNSGSMWRYRQNRCKIFGEVHRAWMNLLGIIVIGVCYRARYQGQGCYGDRAGGELLGVNCVNICV